MKKLLIATTALVGTASVAAADITFSGYGRFGIQFDEDRTISSPARSTSRFDANGLLLDSDGNPATVGVVDAATGVPLDVNGDDATISGLPQATVGVTDPRAAFNLSTSEDSLESFLPAEAQGTLGVAPAAGDFTPVYTNDDGAPVIFDDGSVGLGAGTGRFVLEDPLSPGDALLDADGNLQFSDPAFNLADWSANTKDAEETRLESRFRLNIAASTETDGGVRFAALVRGEANEGSRGEASALSWSGPRFQASAGGFRLQVGNLSGVTDSGEITNTFGFEPGLTGKHGHYSNFGGDILGAYDAFSSTGAGNQGISIKYEMGDFAFMASWADDFDDKDPVDSDGTDRETWEIGASYTVSGWTIGALYGEGDYGDEGPVVAVLPDGSLANLQGLDYSWWLATATGSIGAADVSFFIGDTDVSGDDVAYGVSGSFPVSASTNIVAAISGGGFDALDTAYSIGFDHNLGGGVNLRGMVGSNEFDQTVADLGVIFNF